MGAKALLANLELSILFDTTINCSREGLKVTPVTHAVRFTTVGEGVMGTSVFLCPVTGKEVSTGIEMDAPTLVSLRKHEVSCPHCPLTICLQSTQRRLPR